MKGTKYLSVGILLCAIFIGILTILKHADYMYWQYLRVGLDILHTHVIPHIDIYSITTKNSPILINGWLSSALMAWIALYFGYIGNILLYIGIMIGSCIFVYKACRLHSCNQLISSLLVLAFNLVSSQFLEASPQLITIALFSMCVYILIRYEHTNRQEMEEKVLSKETTLKKEYLIYLIPVVMCLWVNLDVGWVTGVLLMIIYLGVVVVRFIRESQDVRTRTQLKIFSIVFFLSCIALFVNPYGIQILKTWNTYFLTLASPNFHTPEITIFFLSIVVYICLLLFNRRHITIFSMLASICFLGVSLYSSSAIPLFAITSVPILGVCITDVWSRFSMQNELNDFSISLQKIVFSNKLILFIVLLFLIKQSFYLLPIYYGQGIGALQAITPLAAVQYMKDHHLKGPILNEYTFGGYILYDHTYVPFLDGIGVSNPSITNDYLKLVTVTIGIDKTLNKYHIGTIIIRTNSQLDFTLERNIQWKNVFHDATATVYIRHL